VSADLVWPEENEIDLSLALLTKLKILAMSINPNTLPLDGIYYPDNDLANTDGDGSDRLKWV
jgi:hypothetical protein